MGATAWIYFLIIQQLDAIMNSFFYLWIIFAVLCVLLETVNPGLFLFLSFALGAFITAFFALFISSLATQCIVFLIASMGSLILLIKWVKKTTEKSHVDQKTNTQALLGRQALVVRAIYPDSPGEVKIGGELWMARAVHNQSIEVGSRVIVVQVRGAHVVVEPLID